MLKKHEIPILEYDDTFEGVIHAPNLIQELGKGELCVITFFQDVITKLLQENKLRAIAELTSEYGVHPVYEMEYYGRNICLFHPVLGGSLAAAFLEELIAFGFRKFIACGGSGVLDPTLHVGSLIVPTKALRAEGASYHYLPPSRYVEIDQQAIHAIETVLKNRNLPYVKGMTWTTDAYFRETREMINYRRDEGCIAVEMECASFAAAAKFRKVTFGQILYSGDDISKEIWDSRKWKSKVDIRYDLVTASIEACLLL